MAVSDEDVKRQYDAFDPGTYCTVMQNWFAPQVDFYLEKAHAFFQSDPFAVNLKDGKCLEFGSGPTFHSVLSASRKCSSIVACEFNKDNREALKKWIRADSDALQFPRFLQTVVRLEGYLDFEEGSNVICNRLRRCYKGVYPCDALQETPVPPEAGSNFDVVISSLCLEAATLTLEKFSLALQRIGKLLKPGGRFLLMGVLQQTYWHSGDEKYPSLYLTQESIEEAFKSAGFGDFQWSQKDGIDGESKCDASGVFFVIASRH